MTHSLAFDPFLSWLWMALLFIAALGLLAAAWRRRARDFYARAAFFVLLAVIISNPVLMKEKRESLPDKILVIVDDSASQKIGGRDKNALAAADRVAKLLAGEKDLTPVVVHAGAGADKTELFKAVRDNAAAIPANVAAGVIMITDGEVHDAPQDPASVARFGPLTAVLTGRKDEFDRKVTIVSAPKYGVIGQDVTFRVRIDEYGRKSAAPIDMTASADGTVTDVTPLMPGEEHDVTFKITHPGQNIFTFSIPAEEGELTAHNNESPVIVNGIRDRLHVLLVSGAPHMGERAWRNLLKSDPAIDLVHFTILRPPSSMDPTPQNELALIVFPVEELFERKIKDFDLIIFDRYEQYGLLLPEYFSNIADFVRDGGALLMAMGTDQPDRQVGNTALADILPMSPGPNDIIASPYTPALSVEGKSHPVTADLQKGNASAWGQWQAVADMTKARGDTVMEAGAGRPLLVLDQVGKGRVAVLASDNIWLWSKSATAGPYNALLRNLAHWLMKEPELEQDYLKTEVKGDAIHLSMRGRNDKTLQMTAPDGKTQDIILQSGEGGWLTANVVSAENGIYTFAYDGKKVFAVVGNAQNPEFSDVQTTPDKLSPVIAASKGAVVWSGDRANFSAGDLKIRRNHAYTVSSVESRSLLPEALALLLALGGMFLAWRRESGR